MQPNQIDTIIERKPYLRPLLERKSDASYVQADVLYQNQKPVGSRNPEKEAYRSIPDSLQSLKGTEIIIMLGPAAPLFFQRIESFLHPQQICISVEADPDISAALLKNDHVLLHLGNPGRHFFVGEEMLPLLQSYLDNLPAERLSGIRLISGPSRRRNPDFYDAVEIQLKEVIKSRISNLLTRFEFEQKWVKNIIINTDTFARFQAHSISELKNILTDIPALLIAAGPSLKESLPYIKKLQNKAFLLACDTALKVLLKENIYPHAVMTLDGQKHSLFHYLGEDLSQMILFTDIVVHPSVIERLNPGKIYYSSTAREKTGVDGNTFTETTPGTDYFENRMGPAGYLQSGGSVATSAFDLLHFMNASPIMLIGQDLAYTYRTIHSPGTHHAERWLARISRINPLETIIESVVQKRNLLEVPALKRVSEKEIQSESKRTTVSDYILSLYLSWFDRAIDSVSTPVYNLTAKGATIASAIESNLNELDSILRDITIPEKLRLPSVSGGHDKQKNNSITGADNQGSAHAREIRQDAEAMIYEMDRFISDLRQNPASAENRKTTETFFKKHPYFKVLSRKAELYIRRNQDKLEEGRINRLYTENIIEALEKIRSGYNQILRKKARIHSSME